MPRRIKHLLSTGRTPRLLIVMIMKKTEESYITIVDKKYETYCLPI